MYLFCYQTLVEILAVGILLLTRLLPSDRLLPISSAPGVPFPWLEVVVYGVKKSGSCRNNEKFTLWSCHILSLNPPIPSPSISMWDLCEYFGRFLYLFSTTPFILYRRKLSFHFKTLFFYCDPNSYIIPKWYIWTSKLWHWDNFTLSVNGNFWFFFVFASFG